MYLIIILMGDYIIRTATLSDIKRKIKEHHTHSGTILYFINCQNVVSLRHERIAIQRTDVKISLPMTMSDVINANAGVISE